MDLGKGPFEEMGPYFAEKVPKISKIATRAINVLIGIIHTHSNV